MEIEITKQLGIIAVAIWILVFAIYKIPGMKEEKFPKELMAIIIGILTAVAGALTGFFTGSVFMIVANAIIAIFVSQLTYDKIKAIFPEIKKAP